MPIYAYRCESCGHAKDVLRRISDPVLTLCPACGKETFRKQVTAAGFQLKGSGWYVTDFRDGKKPARKEGESAADGGAKPAAGESASGDGAGSTPAAPAVGEPKSAANGSKSESAPAPAPAPAPAAPAAPPPASGKAG